MLADSPLPPRAVYPWASHFTSLCLLPHSQNEDNYTRLVEFCKPKDKAQVKGLAEQHGG